MNQSQISQMSHDELLAQVRTPYKHSEWLISPSYKKGEVDSNAVDTPHLFWYEGRYRMLHNCFDGTGYRTGLASSDDLLHWDREGIIADRGAAGSLTEFNIGVTSVLRDQELYGRGDAQLEEGKLIGVWHGYPEKGQEQGRGYWGVAYGNNLKDWKFEDACIRAEDEDAGEWEKGGIYKPCIVKHEGRYFVFYNAKDTLEWPWIEQIGMAYSDDLKTWIRYTSNPIVPIGPQGSQDDIFTADPCVLKYGETWVMFYYGLSSDGFARELVAFSDDLMNWRKSDEILIDVGPEGSVDDQYAHKSGIIAKDGVLYHYYGASRKKTALDIDEVDAKDRRGIVVATSKPI